MNRPTTLPTGAPVTRPACPPWCVHNDLCELGAYATDYRHLTASAGLPLEGDVLVPYVSAVLLQDAGDPVPFVAVSAERDDLPGGLAAPMRSHEARHLAAVLLELADLADGVTR